MNKQEIFNELRRKCNSVIYPSRIDFNLEQDTLKVKMNQKGVLANMQEDNSAFEGWILVIMSIFNKEEEKIKFVKFSWESADKKTGHYHRFVYRVIKFGEKFSWFKIEFPNNSKEIEEFRNQYLINNDILVLNYPKIPAREVLEGLNEAFLERLFKENPELIQKFQLEYIDQQLPVGVFDGKVKKGNNVFTGGKSGIDLWGIKDKEFFIFELKYNNRKVGIISEILLYLWIMEDLFINKKIKYPVVSERVLKINRRNFRIIYKKVQEYEGINKILGVLLADRFYCLVNKDLIDYLNKYLGSELAITLQQYEYSLISGIKLK